MNTGLSIVPWDTLLEMHRVALTCPPGTIVEVGVYKGGSAVELQEVARTWGARLHLFDTFSGMPEKSDGDKHEIGDFADTSLEAVKRVVPDAICHAGIFPATLPRLFGKVSFVHCDVDQYRSTLNVITSFWDRLKPGGVMWFDDYVLPSARRAIDLMFTADHLEPAPNGRVYVRKNA